MLWWSTLCNRILTNGLIEQFYRLNTNSSNPTLTFYVQHTVIPEVQTIGYVTWELATVFNDEVTVSSVHLYSVHTYSHVEMVFNGSVYVKGY